MTYAVTSAVFGFIGGLASVGLFPARTPMTPEDARAIAIAIEPAVISAMERRGYLRNPEAIILEKLAKPQK